MVVFTLEALYQKYLLVRSVTIDSRHVPPGALFFAMRGPRFNGNAFAREALDKGASYAIIDDPAYAGVSAACILVKNTLLALMQLAVYHRLQYGKHFPLIAITGSYGKTTTKELMYSVLRTTYSTVATKGNLNTSIGVCLTILAMLPETEIAVVEIGATQLGDVALCCQIAQPTYGLITAIGEAHLEGFGSIEGVMQGKGELYDYLYATGGKLFLNTSQPLLVALSQRCKDPITYPQPMDFAPLDLVAEDPYLHYTSPGGSIVKTHLLGRPHIHNIAAALCVASYFQLPREVANRAIQAYIPRNRRMELVQQGSNQIIMDSYNASPASVQAALEALLQLQVAYRVVILSDMAELGSQAAIWHDRIVAQLVHPGYDLVLLCGMLFTTAARQYPVATIHCFNKVEQLTHYLADCCFQHSGFLVKGSHAWKLDSLLAFIR
ncbi:MAG: UDP-N-acetylmuramoyl-tripeptide--D-alanyl-D-alanine ligase [Candidatus Cardinium sp.]|nr:UDP-N-acetylmuramoyl-tripeptide--D-alanyl-D-alanine ligase [Candidatus Cardinium sp.]